MRASRVGRTGNSLHQEKGVGLTRDKPSLASDNTVITEIKKDKG